MEHSFLKDIKTIKNYLEKNLSNEYSISLLGASIEVRRNNYILLLQIIYQEFCDDYPIIKLFFSTYATNIFIDKKEICYDTNKIIHFSNGEDYLWITSGDEYINEGQLKKLVDSVEIIFDMNENIQPFLQKIIEKSY